MATAIATEKPSTAAKTRRTVANRTPMGAGNWQFTTLPAGAVTRTGRRTLDAFGMSGSSVTTKATRARQRKGWVTPWVAMLRAEATWGSEPVKSRWTAPRSAVKATRIRTGTSDWRSSSM